MDGEKIREYARIMRELDLTGMEINEKKGTIRLERDLKAPAAESVSVRAETQSVSEDVQVMTLDKSSNQIQTVVSPMVGVFYAAPAQDADPYISTGDIVEKGQVLCIIEAMKLMNEITAEDAGVVENVLAADGQLVEFGTPLLTIRKEL